MKLRELPILQYQNVSDSEGRLWLPAHAFSRQIGYLSRGPFRILSIDDALDLMEGREEEKDLPCLSLTFDNGFQDLEEQAFPLLARHRFPATLLLAPPRAGTSVSMASGKADYLSWSALRRLSEGGITIGAYEDQALNLNSLPEELVRDHIVEYKKQMEDRLGREVRYFGVKEGIPGRRIRDLLIEQGYRAFLTQCPTFCRPDPFSLGRIQIDDDDFNIFLTKISRFYLFFKDKRSWKYIRRCKLDRLGHRLSETYDRYLK